MNSQSPTLQPTNINLLQGTGKCTVAGCGCTGFSASPAGPNTPPGNTCIGKNSAGGTCNHTKDQHE